MRNKQEENISIYIYHEEAPPNLQQVINEVSVEDKYCLHVFKVTEHIKQHAQDRRTKLNW